MNVTAVGTASATPPTRFSRILPTIPGYALGGAVFLAILYLAWHLQDERVPKSLNILICLLAATFGWTIGILLSPKNRVEKEQFLVYGKSISAFVSGYLLSKLDPLFTDAIKAGPPATVVLSAQVAFFLACFLLGALFVYIGRNI